jgi:hypothetical protein
MSNTSAFCCTSLNPFKVRGSFDRADPNESIFAHFLATFGLDATLLSGSSNYVFLVIKKKDFTESTSISEIYYRWNGTEYEDMGSEQMNFQEYHEVMLTKMYKCPFHKCAYEIHLYEH